METVSIVKGGSADELVTNALSLLGLRQRLKPGSKVVVKPNLVRIPRDSPYAREPGAYETCPPEGDIVHREIVAGTLKAFQALGVNDLTIAEASGGVQTPLVYKALDLYALADKLDVRIVDLNYEDSDKVPVPNPYHIRSIWVPRLIRNADFLVNIAVLKPWSLSLKNWGIGILPGKYYGWNKAADQTHGGRLKGIEEPLPIHTRAPLKETIEGQEAAVNRLIVDVCATQRCDLAIIDGLAYLRHGTFKGLHRGELLHPNLVLAGYNMVAVDAISRSLMGLEPRGLLHIRWAAERGLGPLDPNQIEVKGIPLEKSTLEGD